MILELHSVTTLSVNVSSGFLSIANKSSRRCAPRTERELMNALTPAHSAGEQVVRADHRCLASHASVLGLVSSAAQLPFR
jgi:hypothetical protein